MRFLVVLALFAVTSGFRMRIFGSNINGTCAGTTSVDIYPADNTCVSTPDPLLVAFYPQYFKMVPNVPFYIRGEHWLGVHELPTKEAR